MSRIRRTTLTLWILAGIALTATLAAKAWRRPTSPAVQLEAPVPSNVALGSVGHFALTDDHGREVRSDDWRGDVWVAGFIFTRCAGPCLRIAGRMALLDQELPQEGVRLVCFSVDPEYDTPDVLTRYRATLKLDSERLTFVTGPREPLYRLIRESFHLAVEPAKDRVDPGEAIAHSTRLVVVDQEGGIRGYYEADDEQEMERLIGQVHALLGGPS